MENFKEELAARTRRAEEITLRYLPQEEGAAKLVEAMDYAVQAGGKRIRPVLLLESYGMFGGEGEAADPFAAAIEYIHTHSLIHDDLPALDDDDYRRGRLTTHKVYGEDFGVLAGDALLNHAYETMLLAPGKGADPARCLEAMKVMASHTGHRGMLGGQSVDVENDGIPVSEETLQYIYKKKTSALLQAPLLAGAILAGASEECLPVLEEVGLNLGLAFQVVDDILDETSTLEELGKATHSDEKNQKTTYVTLYGLEKAQEWADTYTGKAIHALKSLPCDTAFMEELLRQLSTRRK